MDNQKFAGRVTLLVLVNLLVKLVWILFIERKVQTSVGFQSFGLYYSVFNFTLILGVINDPGLNNYLIQYLSKEKKRPQYISDLFSVKIILAVLYTIITLISAWLLGLTDENLLGLLVIYQILFSFLNYLRGFLKGNQLLKAEIFLSVLDKCLIIVALLPILYLNTGFKWTIQFYILAQMLALLIAIAWCFYYLYLKKISILPSKKIRLNFSIIQRIAPFALFAFLVLAYNKIDTVMLVKMLPNGDMESGIYVAAYRFLDAASMLPILFATLFYPVLCKLIGEDSKVERLMNDSVFTLIPTTLIIAMVSWFYRNELMELLYPENSSQKLSIIFGVLMFCLPLVVIYYVYSTYFTANNNLKLLNLVSAGGLITNIALNTVLIPTYQALGAAFSSFISFLLVGLTYLLLYHQQFKKPFRHLLWFKLLLFIGFLIVLGYLTPYAFDNWMLSIAIYTLMSTAIAMCLGFFKLSHLRTAIVQKL